MIRDSEWHEDLFGKDESEALNLIFSSLDEASKSPHRLRRLNLQHTEFSDTGIQDLVKIKNVQFLDLRRTSVIANGIRQLSECAESRELRLPQDRLGEWDEVIEILKQK